jgi:cob(I)alamin adenosyltransferase
LKIYTRTGDDGSTGLFGGGRVAKTHPRIAAYGTVDELNSVLGLAITLVVDAETRGRLELLQHDLFVLGSHLSVPPPEGTRPRPRTPDLPRSRVAEMEGWMDSAELELPPLREFILPGGAPGAAALHLARTVCRRAEREVIALGEREAVEEDVLRYLNRLSDLLFVLSRHENHRTGTPEVLWNSHA